MTIRKNVLRRTQVLVTDHEGSEAEPDIVIGRWKDIKFHQLKKSDVFRLFDSNEDGTERPDVVTDEGHHQVCVAVSDAEPTGDGSEGLQNYVVQSLALNGL